jgi:hypothetical protein
MSSGGFDQYGFALAPKPPRPAARTGAGLLMAGGVVHMLAVFMPWYQGKGVPTLKGMDSFFTVDGTGYIDAPGKVWLVIGALLFALGLATFIVGRILAIAVIAAIVSIAGLFGAILGFGVVKNERDAQHVGDVAFGVIVGTLAIFAALAGSIQVLAKRRR